jgi:hypothetical protein
MTGFGQGLGTPDNGMPQAGQTPTPSQQEGGLSQLLSADDSKALDEFSQLLDDFDMPPETKNFVKDKLGKLQGLLKNTGEGAQLGDSVLKSLKSSIKPLMSQIKTINAQPSATAIINQDIGGQIDGVIKGMRDAISASPEGKSLLAAMRQVNQKQGKGKAIPKQAMPPSPEGSPAPQTQGKVEAGKPQMPQTPTQTPSPNNQAVMPQGKQEAQVPQEGQSQTAAPQQGTQQTTQQTTQTPQENTSAQQPQTQDNLPKEETTKAPSQTPQNTGNNKQEATQTPAQSQSQNSPKPEADTPEAKAPTQTQDQDNAVDNKPQEKGTEAPAGNFAANLNQETQGTQQTSNISGGAPIESSNVDQTKRIDTIKEIVTQMVKNISTVENKDATTIKMTLQAPPELKGVQIEIKSPNTSKEQLDIKFTNLNNEQAKYLNENVVVKQQQLEQALQSSGHSVNKLEVDIPTEASAEPQGEQEGNQDEEQGEGRQDQNQEQEEDTED